MLLDNSTFSPNYLPHYLLQIIHYRTWILGGYQTCGIEIGCAILHRKKLHKQILSQCLQCKEISAFIPGDFWSWIHIHSSLFFAFHDDDPRRSKRIKKKKNTLKNYFLKKKNVRECFVISQFLWIFCLFSPQLCLFKYTHTAHTHTHKETNTQHSKRILKIHSQRKKKTKKKHKKFFSNISLKVYELSATNDTLSLLIFKNTTSNMHLVILIKEPNVFCVTVFCSLPIPIFFGMGKNFRNSNMYHCL